MARRRRVRRKKKRRLTHSQRTRAWFRRKCAADPTWKLRFRLQSKWAERCREAGVKGEPFLALLGCEWHEFARRLEETFEPHWHWQNLGTAWVCDHRLPYRSFRIQDPEDRAMCCHASNLQALDLISNAVKNGHYTAADLEMYKTAWRRKYGNGSP